MPEIAYIDKQFRLETRQTIATARRICAEYRKQGFDLTLRQLFYQFVAHDLFHENRTWRQTPAGKWVRDPSGTKNAEPNYKYLGDVVNDARMAGLLDWRYIVDRTRTPAGGTGWMTDPAQVIEPGVYSIDKWQDQDHHVEVWIEKEALAGVLQRACPQFEVVYFSCRGYTSASAMWQAAQRHGSAISDGKQVRIIHLGDHDPSGIDMTRDIEERLATFIAQDLGYCGTEEDAQTCVSELWPHFEVNRVALNMDQIRRYNPPPNPAKLSDSRGSGYVARYGSSSWELDALDPGTLVALIQTTIESYRDEEKWEAKVDQEDEEKKILTATKNHWPDIAEYVRESWPDEVGSDGTDALEDDDE